VHSRISVFVSASASRIGRDVPFVLFLLICLAAFPARSAEVTVNEILANNQSIAPMDAYPDYFPDYVELHNNGGRDINLAAEGWSLSTKKAPLANDFKDHYYFPPGTILPVDSSLLVFFDNKTNFPGLHTTWTTGGTNVTLTLKRTGDRVLVFKANGSSLVESNAFGLQIPDYSVGRFPDFTGPFTLTLPSPCGPCTTNYPPTNTPATFVPAPSASNTMTLKINEWVGTNSAGADKDWFEVYNPDTNIVELSGLIFVDKPANLLVPSRSRPMPPLSYISPLGFVQLFASDNNNPDAPAEEVAFSISSSGADGDEIYIFANNASIYFSAGTNIDHVHTSAHPRADTSEGRVPDGGDTIIILPKLSPEASNFGEITNVVINEVLTHTDLPLEDAIEFYNTTGVPVDISNYWLSNDKNNPMKYRFPPGSIIPAHGYKVVYEGRGTTSGFNTGGLGEFPQFTFNSANGDEAWLYSGTSTGGGRLTGFRTGVSFGASANGVSFGRYMTSDGRADFIAMTALSFGTSVTASDPPSQSYLNIFRTGTGAANPDPRVGPIVINEIHFHPPDIVSGTNFFDNSIDEFVELYNITDTAIPLYDPAIYRADRDYSANEVADGVAIHRGEIYADGRTNTWRVRGTVDFDFPQNTTLAPGKFILVVNFDPTNTPVLNSFKTRFAVPNDTQIFGPYGGKLPNGNGGVDLTRPDPPQGPQHPDYHLVPRVLIDHVKYYDRDPWPTLTDAIVPISTDGGGASLQRISAYGYGNDPVNWRANPPTAGKYNTPSGIEAPSITTQPHDVTVSAGSTATFTVVAHGGQLRYQWIMDGAPISNETNATLRLLNVSTLLNHKFLVVTVTNVAGELSSTPVMLTVTQSQPDSKPPSIQIVSPSAASLTDDAIIVSGKSSDDIGVNSVVYSINGGSSIAATGSVTWSAWGTPYPVLLNPGTNVIRATATDQAGNTNMTTRTYFLSVHTPLTLSTNGQGGVLGATNQQRFEVGRTVSLTAKPGIGQVFSNWVIVTNSIPAETRTTPALSYLMSSNLAITANFTANPFVAPAGTYNGLFYVPGEVQHGSSGFFTLAVTDRGTYTAKLLHDGRKLSAAGQFDLFGQASNEILRAGTNSIRIYWNLDLAAADKVSGTVSNADWAASLGGDRAYWTATRPYPSAGKYTFAIMGFPGAANAPAGHSYGTIVVAANGVAKLSGFLADKTKAKQTVPLSKDGLMPLYFPQVKGSLIAWVAFTNRLTDDLHSEGVLSWNKQPNPSAPFYKTGFGDDTSLSGSRYVAPVAPASIVPLTAGLAVFADGNLPPPAAYTNTFALGPSSKFTNGQPNAMTLAFTASSGLFKGTFKPPGAAKPLAFTGVVLQKGTNGFGYILGTNQSSSVTLRPAP
jgi:hypothetical protein